MINLSNFRIQREFNLFRLSGDFRQWLKLSRLNNEAPRMALATLGGPPAGSGGRGKSQHVLFAHRGRDSWHVNYRMAGG